MAQIYIAVLKFDFFFFLGFTVQFLVIVTNTPDAEFGITIAAIPVTIAILIFAAWACKRESLWGSLFVLVRLSWSHCPNLLYYLFFLLHTRLLWVSVAHAETTTQSRPADHHRN